MAVFRLVSLQTAEICAINVSQFSHHEFHRNDSKMSTRDVTTETTRTCTEATEGQVRLSCV